MSFVRDSYRSRDYYKSRVFLTENPGRYINTYETASQLMKPWIGCILTIDRSHQHNREN
jgi:hypothetical protein